MTIEPVTQSVFGGDTPDVIHLQGVQDENQLLLEQLKLVQEELERLHYQPAVVPEGLPSTVIQIAPVDERLIQVQAENIRYQALLEVQTELCDLQSRYALANQLGDMLIQGTRSAGALLSLPRRLHQTWRKHRRTTPPAILGGKSFDKFIQVYQQGGLEKAQDLLNRSAVSGVVQASAWTAAARTHIPAEPELATSLAARAYALEPRGFRQKWLAFRLHESGALVEAEAWLALLPLDVPFTDSELRQKERLQMQAEQCRQEQALQMHDISAQQEQVQRQWEELARSRDILSMTAERQCAQLLNLKNQVQSQTQDCIEQTTAVGQLQTRVQVLQQELVQARQDCIKDAERISEQQQQLETLSSEIAVHKQAAQVQQDLIEQGQQECVDLRQSIAALEQAVLEEKELVAQWFEQCRILQGGIAELMQEKNHLQMQGQQQIEGLSSQLEELAFSRDEQQAFAAQKQSEYASLCVDLDALQLRFDEQAEELDQDKQQVESLQTQLEELLATQEEQGLLALQKEDECESLSVALSALQLKFEDQVALVEHEKQSSESLREQVEALLEELGQEKAHVRQEREEHKSVQSALDSLMQVCEEQTHLAAQRLERCESTQMELNAMSRAHAEQATLVAQGQGELLQQSREQLNLEKLKTALEVKNQELEQKLTAQVKREASLLQKLSVQIQSLADREIATPQALQSLFQSHTEELARVHKQIEVAVQKGSVNTARQIQSFVGMQEYFATGVLPAFNSESHSWPVSADFALCLMQRVVLEDYDLVIEFGSGMSTVILAKTLALRAERDPSATGHFISFDHLDSYYQQTLGYLKQSGVDSFVQLTLAPLQEWQGPDGQTYPYYSCQKALAQLAKQRSTSKKRILVIVDGPPAATGPRARYPAGPIVMQHFPDAHIDFLMDDFIRQDEKEVAKQWQRDVKAAGLLSAVRNFKFEKDACLITVHPKDSK